MRSWILGAGLFLFAFAAAGASPLPAPSASPLPAPSASVIPQAWGYVAVPGAAIQPDKSLQYRAVFSATEGAAKPDKLVPAVQVAGAELNMLAASGFPLARAHYVIDFHGAKAVYGLLNNAAYRQKFGTDNPNLPVLAALKKSGVQLYVCSQQLLAMGVNFNTITPQVTIASDGLFVLISLQNQGYAWLPF